MKAPIKTSSIRNDYKRLHSITYTSKTGFTTKPKLTLSYLAGLIAVRRTINHVTLYRRNKIVTRILLIGFVRSLSIYFD